MNIYDTLARLQIALPPVAIPAAAYVPFVQTGNLVFSAGTSPKKTANHGSANLVKPWLPKRDTQQPVPLPLI
jgi:hypothetical protein